MEQRMFVVTWDTQTGHQLSPAVCQIAREALRLSVWRAGGIALACRVMPTLTRMVLQVPLGHDPHMHVEWVRAAARFAVTRMTHGTPLPWNPTFVVYPVSGTRVADEITACLMLDFPEHQSMYMP